MLALTGCTGKIGGAVLNSIITEQLIPHDQLVICTSSDPSNSHWNALKDQGATVRQSSYDDPESMRFAFSGCSKLLLVSTPHIDMDFNDARNGHGREKHHIAAIKAAVEAGVQHIYYTSLAFGSESRAGVMSAHLRTEAFLASLKDILTYTIVRVGLYNESWPLYLGYYDPKNDDREEIIIAGDGPVSWTSIDDLGLAAALIVTAPGEKYAMETRTISSPSSATLKDIASIVSRIMEKKLAVKIVSREEYCDHYVSRGRDRAAVEWWSTTYRALTENECLIHDQTLPDLLKGAHLTPIEETVKAMLSKGN